MLSPRSSEDFRKGVVAATPMLKRRAIALCRDASRAEDLVQETVLRALEHERQFTVDTNLDAWLGTILKNFFLSGIRKTGREVEDGDGAIADSVSVDAEDGSAMDLESTQEVISALPAEQASALRLIADGDTYEEAAKKQGVSVGTIKSRVNRARQEVFITQGGAALNTMVPDYSQPRQIDPSPYAHLVIPATSFGPVPELRWIEICLLRIDPEYQRDVLRYGRKNILKIAAEFDWTKFAPVIVAPLVGGLYAVVDGQHRTTAAALCGIESVPCSIIRADPGQQAAAFAAINGCVTQTSTLQLHAARIVAGEPDAVALAAVCKSAGVEICRYPVPNQKIRKGQTLAVVCLRHCLKARGAEVLTLALECVTKTRDGNRGMLRAPIIEGLCEAVSKSRLSRAEVLKVMGGVNLARVFMDCSIESKRLKRPIRGLVAEKISTVLGVK